MISKKAEKVGPDNCNSKCYTCLKYLQKSCSGEPVTCDRFKSGHTEFRKVPQECSSCGEEFHYSLFDFRGGRCCFECYAAKREEEDRRNPYGPCSITEKEGINLDNVSGYVEPTYMEVISDWAGAGE